MLIKAVVRDGDNHAYGVLYDRYVKRVYRKCMSFSKEESIAEDLVQEIFLKVHDKLSKFRGNSSFSTWLYAITYNHCVEHCRKRNKVSAVDITEYPEHPEENPDEEELMSTRLEQLKSALDQVDPNDRMILVMKYQENVPIKDIMSRLRISESAVKMRLSRARQRVRQVFRDLERA